MKNLNFYASRNFFLLEKDGIDYEKSKYVVLGVPFDSTVSFRPGCRFGPDRIREFFYQLETYDIETGLDFEDIDVYDGGNLSFETNTEYIIKKIRRIVSEIVSDKKIPVLLGGEHTITLGGIKGLLEEDNEFFYIVFDAHLDMRDEYPLGSTLTHATVNRRIIEEIGEENILVIGVRAFSKEEYKFVKEHNIRVYPVDHEIDLSILKNRSVYVSIDLDVLDPSIAPGVGNPEPLGMSLKELLSFLKYIGEHSNVRVIDIVELNPVYDINGLTTAVASKILQKTLIYIEYFFR